MENKLPVLTTERLILREVEDDDYQDMYEYSKLPYVGPSAGWQPHGSPAETKAIIKMFQGKRKYGQLGVFSVILKNSGKMIGTIELHTYTIGHKAELGYTISPYYWGKGYAVEASKKLIAWGFDTLGLKRIECATFPDNAQSRRVCEKLGLTHEGIRRKGYLLYNGTVADIDCYSIIDDEFFERIRNNNWW